MTLVETDSARRSGWEVYDRHFFSSARDRASRSAEAVAPYLVELLDPESVVDVGCGDGSWLAPFASRGVEILGVDGPWAKEALEIPSERFVAADLDLELDLGRRFDLVLSLEVAEHLEPASAPSFVATLARLGPVVVFSAAVPGQGGIDHLNEQWPEYWADLFAGEGFVPVDCLRNRFWSDERVAPYYAQNAVLFVEVDALERLPALRRELRGLDPVPPPPLVHPATLGKAVARLRHCERGESKSAEAREGDRRKLDRLGRRLTAIERSRWWRLGQAMGMVRTGAGRGFAPWAPRALGALRRRASG